MADVTDDGGASQTPSNDDPPPVNETEADDDSGTSESISAMAFGGKRPQQSFALLDGFDVNKKEPRTTIDITTIPAVLGRYNEGDVDNPNFFGLGTKKAFSRRHVSIYYRDKEGGRVEWDEKTQSTVYKDAKTVEREEGPQSMPKGNGKFGNSALPANGFFVIESLGKNRIVVDKKALYQGESMVLHSGSNISISTYFYVFLLPTDAEPTIHTIDMGEKKKAPAKKTASSKKRSASASSSSSAPSKKPKKAGTSSGPTTTLVSVENLPVEDLLEKMDEAVFKGLWDRRCQVIGATICYHAVRAAGMSPEIQQKVHEDGGVSRSDVMDWIKKSDKFGGWVQQMLTNMEPRSYQAAVTKSLLKSGFARTTGAGRYIKWELPEDIPLKLKKKKKKKNTFMPEQAKAAMPSPIKKEPMSEPSNSPPAPEEEEAPDNEEQQQDDDEASSRHGEEEEEAGEGDANENEKENANDPAPEENNEEQPAKDDSEMDVIV